MRWAWLFMVCVACSPCATDPPAVTREAERASEGDQAGGGAGLTPLRLPIGVHVPPRPAARPREASVELGPLPVVWRTPLPRFCFPKALSRIGDALLACCGEDAFVLDAESGAIRATTELHPGECAFAAADGDGWVLGANVLVMGGSTVLGRATFVARLDLDGSLRWRTQLDADYLRDAVLRDGRLLVLGNTRDRAEPAEGRLFELDPATGTLDGWHALGATAHSLASGAGGLLVGRSTGSPGLRAWREGESEILGERPVNALGGGGDWIAVATHSALFEPGPRTFGVEVRDGSSFEQRWSSDAGAASVAVDGDVLAWVGGDAGQRELVLRDVASGRERWRAPLPGLRSVAWIAGPFVAVHTEPVGLELVRRADGRAAGPADWSIAPEVRGDRIWAGLTGEVACLSLDDGMAATGSEER